MKLRFGIWDLRFFPRSGFGFCLLGLFAGLSSGWAQDAKPKEILTIELSAIALGVDELPPLYFVELKPGEGGKMEKVFQPFPVAVGSRGATVKIPITVPVQLFTGTFDEKGKPDMKPFLDVPANKPGDRLILVIHFDMKGQLQKTFLDDSAATHPPGQVRVVNFSNDRMAFTVGGSQVLVAAGAEGRAEPVLNEQGRFPFVHFVERTGQKPYQSPTKLLRFRNPGSRLLVLYTALPTAVPTGETGPDGGEKSKTEYQPIAYRLYDSIAGAGNAGGSTAGRSLPKSGGENRPTVGTAPAATPAQNQSVGLLVLDGAVAVGSELEMLWGGQAAATKVKFASDELTKLQAPSGASASLRLPNGTAIGTATLSPASNQHLVVLAPGDDALGPPGVRTYENSLQTHPAGGVRVFNFTPYQLAYSAGKTIAYINPKEEAIVVFPPEEKSLKLAVKVNEGWKLVMDNKPVKPEGSGRKLLFVSKPPGKEEFAIREVMQ